MEGNKKDNIDWMFLLFLAGVTNVKLYIKIATVSLYLLYIIFKKYRLPKPASIQLFYFIMPVIGLAGALLHQSFSDKAYAMAYAFGTISWLTAGVISYLLYIAVVNIPPARIHKVIKTFFVINSLVSLAELGKMIIDSGNLIPYWDWGKDMYYGGATGDHIYGLTGNISVINATICALGSLYFIFTKEMKWALLCLITSMLCTSNLTLIFLLFTLLLITFFVKDKKIKLYSLYACITCTIIYPVLTYDNVTYLNTVYTEDIKYKEYSESELALIRNNTAKIWKDEPVYEVTASTFRPKNTNYYKTNLNDSFYTTSKSDLKYILSYNKLKGDKVNSVIPADDIKNVILRWYGINHEKMSLATYHYPIKLYTFQQTLNYLLSDPINFIAGAGTGNFSSKQAIKTTGLGLQGHYPVKDLYVNRDFIEYHLYSLLYVLALPVSEHSIINMPNSIYNQVAGEYGALGILSFLVLYVGFFFKNIKKLRYGVYIALMSFIMLGFEYWFEMVSLTVFFELFSLFFIYNVNATEQ